MSRIGRLPITIPSGVTVNINRSEVTIKGPKGELHHRFHPDMSITLSNNLLLVSRPSDSKLHRAQHGLTRTLLANMVRGVTEGFEKTLETVGVGYRAQKAGDKLVINAGYSHTVEVSPPPGISLAVEGATRIKVSGIDKEAVGQTAAHIRAIRRADAYKGKGIKYAGELIRLKPGKAGKAIGGKT